MRVSLSKLAALVWSAVLTFAACGSSVFPPVDPVGGVAAAFEAATAGGTLEQMDLVACLTTGVAVGNAFSGLFSGVTGDALAGAGISPDDLTAAWKIRFDDLTTTETSRSADTATVSVTVKVTSEIDAGRMRELVKRFSATQGIVPDDSTIDAGILAQLGGQLTQVINIDKEIDVAQRDGTWVVCDATVNGAAPTALGSALPGSSLAVPVVEGWQIYRSGGGGYTISLPGPVTTSDRSVPTPVGAARVYEAGWISADGKTVFYTAYQDYPAGYLSGTDPDVALDGAKDSVLSAFSAALETQSGVDVGGLVGRALTGTTSDGRLEAMVFVVGDRVYYLVATGPGLNRPDVDRFLGSFKVTATPPIATAAPAPTPSGTPVPTPTPSPLIATAIAAGSQHSCAIRPGGGLSCWGHNHDGQLGDGTTMTRLEPVMVAGIAAVAGVVTSRYPDFRHTCALSSGGSVSCWGSNRVGQLGDGTTSNALTPVPVSGISDATALAAGAQHTCALRTGGGVACWGENRSGQLGDGTTSTAAAPGAPIPVTVDGLTDATAITAGDTHTCALRVGGQIACWGYGLASGTEQNALTPTNVAGITNAIGVSAGAAHTCALLAGGGIACWGNNEAGQLGAGSSAPYSKVPVPVLGIADARAVSAGQFYTCAVRSDHRVMCWGDNLYGQLGDGTNTASPVPVTVSTITDAKAIAAGEKVTCALDSGGLVRCWGAGPLGNGSASASNTPVVVWGP